MNHTFTCPSCGMEYEFSGFAKVEEFFCSTCGHLIKPMMKKQVEGEASEYTTPSKLRVPAFALCPPFFADTQIANNKWMTDMKPEERKIDRERYLTQFLDLYEILSGLSVVYLAPTAKGLQDHVYFTNAGMYLPHLNEDIFILSNFTAEGRAAETEFNKKWFELLGYKTIMPPYKFEGEAELKYLRDNIYFGGYGIRTDLRALQWIEENFGAKIIPVKETDPYLYHLDCSIFPLNKENIICYVDGVVKAAGRKILKSIEKVANIFPVDRNDALCGICNSIRATEVVINASPIEYMKKTDKYYEEERNKNDKLIKICRKVGLEPIFIDLSEAMKGGALLSCCVLHLNYVDYM